MAAESSSAHAARVRRRGLANGPLSLSYAQPADGADAPGVRPHADPFLHKGYAYSGEERSKFGLEGLLPHATLTLQMEVERTLAQLRDLPTPLQRYCFLQQLSAINVTLFFRLVIDNFEVC